MSHYLPLLILLVLGGLIAVGLTLHALARQLLRPPRMNDGKALFLLNRLTPEDVGMRFEPMKFTVRDAAAQLPVAAWWIPAADSDRTVVLVHGYADAKVGAIAWAPTFAKLGCNVFVYDLRAHGESGGKYSTAGVREADDLDQLLNQIRARFPDQARQIVLLGISLGAAVVLKTASKRSDIAGVILDSPYADFRDAARLHGRVFAVPLPSMHRIVLTIAEKIAGVNFDDARPLDVMKAVHAPILMLHGGNDPLVPRDQIDRLSAAMNSRSNANDHSIVFESAGHIDALAIETARYQAAVSEFIRAVTASAEVRSSR